MGTKLTDLGEFGLIDRLKTSLPYRAPSTVRGIGDDCAILKPRRGFHQIITCDALVENIHFDLALTTAEQLGAKSLAVNLSDIAAMGGTPRQAFLTLGLPPALPVRSIDQFINGLNRIAAHYKVEIAGGDTTASPGPFFINITVIGEVRPKRCFLRSGAIPGDLILTTGTLGDSALGLALLREPRRWEKGPGAAKKYLRQRHLLPTPRLLAAQKLAKSKAQVTAMIDISDGLAQDLGHICRESGVGAIIYAGQLPRSTAYTTICAHNQYPPLEMILTGGEDYELLFTLRPENAKKLVHQFAKTDAPLTVIGEITTRKEELLLQEEDGSKRLLKGNLGFDHFHSAVQAAT